MCNYRVVRTIFLPMKTTLLAVLAMLCITFAASAADVTGKWTAELPGRNGTQTTTFNLMQSGDTVTGTITTPRGDQPIADGKVTGDTISFTQSFPGRDGGPARVIKYTGKISDDHIDFSRDTGRGEPVTFTAKKS